MQELQTAFSRIHTASGRRGTLLALFPRTRFALSLPNLFWPGSHRLNTNLCSLAIRSEKTTLILHVKMKKLLSTGRTFRSGKAADSCANSSEAKVGYALAIVLQVTACPQTCFINPLTPPVLATAPRLQ